MKKIILVAMIALGIFSVSASNMKCSAVPIIDQDSVFADPSTVGVGGVLNYHDTAQTFTVGITGTLTHIDIPILKSPSLTSDPTVQC